MNLLCRWEDSNQTYRLISLGGKNTVRVQPKDRLIIQSPGGGGFGESTCKDDTQVKDKVTLYRSTGSLNQYVMNQETV